LFFLVTLPSFGLYSLSLLFFMSKIRLKRCVKLVHLHFFCLDFQSLGNGGMIHYNAPNNWLIKSS
jgi:hypothetical protein